MNFDISQLESLLPKALGYGENILAAIVLFVVGRWFANKISGLGEVGMTRAKIDTTLRTFASNMIRYGVLTIVGLAILGRFGIETTSFVAVLGAMGFAIGLAMQGTLSSFSSGVLLLLFRPFKVGDVVDAGGAGGRVESLQLFTTVLALPDGSKIIVPNSQIYGSTIHNKSPGGEKIAIAVPIGAAYDADLDQTRAVLTEYVNKIPGVLEGTGHCVLVGFGASSVDWSVRCVVHPDDYWSALELVHDHGKKALDTAGIGMPYTTMDVHIVSNPE